MTKHTKGPWRIEKDSWLTGHVSIGSADHGAFIQVVGEMDWEGMKMEKTENNPVYLSWIQKNQELQANVRLVAAAPELLEALLDLKFKLYGNGQANPQIESLLKRVEGL